MQMIRAVLFDYGMVLSAAPDPEARDRMEALLHAEPEDFQRAYWKHRDAYDRGHLSGADYWRAVITDLKQSADEATLAALLAADTDHWARPNQPVVDWSARLQRAGIKTGILSNLGDAMEHGLRAKSDLFARFAHCTFSHRLGFAKPDQAIYLHAAEGLATLPAHILLLDDREENVAAALDAGMVALQYSSHEAFVETMRNREMEWLLER